MNGGIAMEELEKVRAMFSADRFASDAGSVIEEIGDNYAKVSLKIDDRHRNAMGGIMGGVYFTLADFAFAVASNWQKPGVVAVDSSISFVGVPADDMIFAEAHCVRDGRTICCYLVDVYDGNGTPVAAVKTLGYRKA